MDDAARLRNRLERERRARRQAEAIAERGLRDLWQANQALRDAMAVSERRRRREVGAARDIEAARLELLRRVLAETPGARSVDAYIRCAAQDRPPLIEVLAPADIADALLQRWQRRAAGRGVLLSVDAPSLADGVAIDWQRFTAIADVLCQGAIEWSPPGPLDVSIDVDRSVLRLELPAPDGSLHSRRGPDRCDGVSAPALALARLLAERGEGSLSTVATGADARSVRVELPIEDVERPAIPADRDRGGPRPVSSG